jgi:predicted HNH restriction endonuclease
MARITEEQLVLPSLMLMDNSQNRRITTTILREKLTSIFKPMGEDAEILSGRNDTKFDQIVRNLNAHKTFERFGYAIYVTTRHNQGYYEITENGRAYLKENMPIVNYLLNNDFASDDLKKSFDIVFEDRVRSKNILIFDENTTINEGARKIITSKTYERSSQLRYIAIEHYTKNGRIKCEACCFDFEEFYGDFGKGFIEIHHQKPVFMFEEIELEQTIDRALNNVLPVCPNCHRMIHKKRDVPLNLSEIKSKISSKYTYCN